MADNVPPTNTDELPARLRVHVLAKLLGVTSKAVVAELDKLGAPVRSVQSSIDRGVAEQVRTALTSPDGTAAPAAEPTPAAEPGPAAEAAPDTAAPELAIPLFLPPEPVTAPPRRRASRPAAAPEPAASVEPEPDVPAAAAPPTETADEDEPKRRRRGRRGRGRGRGQQNDDNGGQEGADEDSEQDGAAEAEAEAAPKQPDAAETKDSDTATDTTSDTEDTEDAEEDTGEATTGSRRRRRRRRKSGNGNGDTEGESGESRDDDPPNTVVHEREPRSRGKSGKGQARDTGDQVQGISGSTRLEAKRQRRRDGRDAGRRRPAILSESEFLARREAVNRKMVVRQRGQQTQVAVLEDDVLVEHFVTSSSSTAMVGNIYLGRVQNVLPSMEAAFVDVSRGRNGVLYAGEVDWDAAGLGGKARKIEQALHSGDSVLVQVSKDPMGHKGARLTTQISLPGRFLVYVPGGGSTGISRKLPDTERKRLKEILKRIVPADAGVIIRTASEGVSEEELERDVTRLQAQWEAISTKAAEATAAKSSNPVALYEEPDLLVKVVRDQFNEDFSSLVVAGDAVGETVEGYVGAVAPDLLPRVERYSGDDDVFTAYRIDEQLAKAMERKVWLPSGGTLVIDRTEAMTVVDVNTGKFTGAGGNLEETVTRNNLEAAEEIVRQMRLRDIGGMIVVDFIDMVLESNRDLVLRRLTECLGRDRTRHQVSEVTSLGLVQMTRKRMGAGLIEEFSVPCEHCHGRGVLVQDEPAAASTTSGTHGEPSRRARRPRGDTPVKQTPTVKEPWPAALIPASSAAAQAAAAQAVAPQPEASPAAETVESPTVADNAVSPSASAAGEQPPAAEAASAEQPTPARRSRSRRASRPTAAPQPVIVESDAAPAPEPVVPEPPVESPAVESPAVESPAVESPAVESPAAEPPAAESPAAEEVWPVGSAPSVEAGPAPRKTRPRRASRPTAAPEPVSVPVEPVQLAPQPPVAAPVTAAPASPAAAPAPAVTRPRRRRAAARLAGPPTDGVPT